MWRVHQWISAIELSDQGLYARVSACHVNLYYFMGVSYFMMRRYTDAIHAWVSILTMMEKETARQDQMIARKTERVFGLLAIAMSLCPCRIDETVDAKLREKHVVVRAGFRIVYIALSVYTVYIYMVGAAST